MQPMPKANLSEQLDRAIQALLATSATVRGRRDGAAAKASVAALARVAEQLRGLPREDFHQRYEHDSKGERLWPAKPLQHPK